MSKAYEQSGVNLESGYESVERIKKHIARTHRPGVFSSVGAFGGMFDLSELGLKEPMLVSGTDGVGTKLLVAIEADKHDTIGIDAVAMCVNDVVVQGAEPLYFLDYVAVGKNDPAQIEAIVSGVAEGCVSAGVALVGGETAEMPDMYAQGHYDLAGFTVGAVEKSELITGEQVAVGDVIIGLPSSGIHSNGYSLVRKILFKDHNIGLNTYVETLGKTVGEAILEPTRIYVKPVLSLKEKVRIHGMSHITGGGFDENLPRAYGAGLKAVIETKSFPRPAVFDYLMALGKIDEREMYNIFNMGIGYAIIVSADDVDLAISTLKDAGEMPYLIGRIEAGSGVEVR
ncbi:MAG: phosphoribosylformylglycinamidine cyclo-ligase [Defluviitaleaceae bacterium]|nr:phosphoribosylformylglycinamidine cyclo-ligase [Defluviitaleaceae bacterium]